MMHVCYAVSHCAGVMVSRLGSKPRCSGFKSQAGEDKMCLFLNAVTLAHLTLKQVRE